jgi:hypothetical protein
MKRVFFIMSIVLLACATALLASNRRSSLEPPPGVEPPQQGGDVVTIDQGIWGYVWFWEGDFMPPGPYSGTVTGVSREMRIHELTSVDEVEPPDYYCFYSAVNTPLVAVVQSGSNGFFEVALEPGHYSIFAVEDGLLYANSFYDGNIFSVTVEPGEATSISFDITYLATY